MRITIFRILRDGLLRTIAHFSYEIRHLQERYVVYHFLSLNFSQLGVTGHKMLEREVAILKRVQHPHIVALEEVFETSEV